MDNSNSITIIIPAYNEEKNILNTLSKVFRSIKNRIDKKTIVKVLVVNDGSTDSTYKKLIEFNKNHKITILNNKTNQGMGASIKRGIEFADTDKVTTIPGDDDLPEDLIQKSIDFAFKAEIVAFYLINDEVRGPYRYFLSKINNLLFCLTFNQYMFYFNGPKVYPLAKLKKINTRAKKFALIPEITIKLLRSGVTYCEIPSVRINDDSLSRSLSIISLIETFYIYICCILDIYFFKKSIFDKKPKRIIL